MEYEKNNLIKLGLTGLAISQMTLGVFTPVQASEINTADNYQNEKVVIIDVKRQARNYLGIVVSGGKAAGYTMAAELLNHSLQDSPSTRSYGVGSTMSSKLANTTEHKNLLNSIRNKLKTISGSSYTTSGSFAVTSNTDLYLALNKVSYTVNCTKQSNGVWMINFTYSDTYDFERTAWGKYGSSLGSAAVTALNNYAALSQSAGAIVPYKVTIKCVATY